MHINLCIELSYLELTVADRHLQNCTAYVKHKCIMRIVALLLIVCPKITIIYAFHDLLSPSAQCLYSNLSCCICPSFWEWVYLLILHRNGTLFCLENNTAAPVLSTSLVLKMICSQSLLAALCSR